MVKDGASRGNVILLNLFKPVAYQSANAVMLFVVVVLISVFQLRVLEKREEKLG